MSSHTGWAVCNSLDQVLPLPLCCRWPAHVAAAWIQPQLPLQRGGWFDHLLRGRRQRWWRRRPAGEVHGGCCMVEGGLLFLLKLQEIPL